MTLQAERRPSPPGPTPEPPRPVVGSPRRITPSQAIAARPFLTLLPVLVLMIPSLAIALARAPVHAAEARLLVGGFNVEAQAIPGFVEASRTLAETYSRLVSTRAVSERVGDILDLDVRDVEGHIGGTAVPDSSIIRVTGTGASEREAIRYAAAAAQALEDYADESGTSADLESLLDEYRQASLALNQATARRDALQRQYDARVAAGVVTESDISALTAAQADVDRAQLEAQTLAEGYAESRGTGPTAGNLDLVAPADFTGTDQRANLQMAIAAPLILGSIAGVALATLVANRRGIGGPAHAGRR